MKTLMILIMIAGSGQAFAFDKEDTRIDLHEALLASNKDYNDHKKQSLDQENGRIDSWAERTIKSVVITNDIQVEDRNFQVNDQNL